MHMDLKLPGSTPQLTYLRMLAGAGDPGRFLDVRWRTPAGLMRRRFLPAGAIEDAARLLTRMAARNDVYVGVALRDGHVHGGRAAISHSHLAWVESDDQGTAERLLSFPHPPTMVIASGTPGHLQLYWLLDRPCPVGEVESGHRRLARALAGDPACADAARILRPPETLNHKHNPPRTVTLLAFRKDARVTLAQLTDGLPEDPDPAVAKRLLVRGRTGRTRRDRELLAIPAAEYVRVLTGRCPTREGKVLCPFHTERDPSLQLYPDGGFYCFGSGCRAGGTIFDFAGRLWGIAPRGPGFIELRDRLSEHFDVTETPCS
jgi:hypothetical protein